jgi:two-component system sensor histidine kinase CpxA
VHRLFWKIFLSFWIALIVFAVATMLAASHFLDRMREQQDAANPYVQLVKRVAEGQAIAQRDGIEGLQSWLRELDEREVIPLLLVDQQGHDLLGRPVPAFIAERISRQARNSSHRSAERRAWLARTLIRLPDQTEYRLIPDFQAVTLGRVLRRPRVIALPLTVAALVSGLVCFGLARYLTAPIARLRRATHAYAAGDLAQRVAPSLGTRRDEIADLARDFDRMAQRLQELIAAQKQLLSDVSHELRSPLARLQVALGLARQRAPGQADTELERIEREAERLSDLIGQLLSLARLGSALAPPASETLDLAQLVQSVAADADFEAQARNRRVQVARTLPAVIQANEALLHSALENVVRNAVQHTADGTTVTLSMHHDGHGPRTLAIEVHDHGPGVPEDMLPRLFEPFVRVSDARERTSGGYGLGLAIAERAVRLHGGAIAARNNADGGLTVTIRLPLDQADSAGGEAAG